MLLVEDDENDVETIKIELSSSAENYEVHSVCSLDKAKEYLAINIPYIAIIDFFLADGEKGIQLLSPDEVFDYPIIFMSGQESPEIAANTIKQGAIDYIVKGGVVDLSAKIEESHRIWKSKKDEIIKNIEVARSLKQKEVSLRQKEVSIGELNHRVKNNLQLISNIISLRSLDIDDTKAKQILTDCHSQIGSIAIIHGLLYDSENSDEVHFDRYVKILTNYLIPLYDIKNKIICDISCNEAVLYLDVKFAFPCGLIINELLTNSLKYAFPGDRPGKIKVSLIQEEKEIKISVIDDGIGFKPDSLSKSSFGIPLVEDLVQHELKGTIDSYHDRGTKYVIKFNTEASH